MVHLEEKIVHQIVYQSAKQHVHSNVEHSMVFLAHLLPFLNQMATTLKFYAKFIEFPVGHVKIHSLHMFANEVIRQLKRLRRENLIILYLKKCEIFVGPLAITGAKTSLRLHSLLLDYSTPGTPFYPTRKVRQHAMQTLNIIFPYGKVSRKLINWAFRFLHPFELFRSWWYWILIWFAYLWTFLLGLFTKKKVT